MTHPNLLRIVRSCAKWRSGKLLVATLFLLLVVGASPGNSAKREGATRATSDSSLSVTVTVAGPGASRWVVGWNTPVAPAVMRRIKSIWIEPFGQYDVVCLFAEMTDSTVVPLQLAPTRPELPLPTVPICGTVVRARAGH